MTDMQPDAETTRQRDLLTFALAQAPARLSLAELEARSDDSTAVKTAVEKLVADDLLVRDGDNLAPTPTAARYHELSQGQTD